MTWSVHFTWTCDRCGATETKDTDQVLDPRPPLTWSRDMHYDRSGVGLRQEVDLCASCTKELCTIRDLHFQSIQNWMATKSSPSQLAGWTKS